MSNLNASVRFTVAGLLILTAPSLVNAQGRGRGQDKDEKKDVKQALKVEDKHDRKIEQGDNDQGKVKQPKHVTVSQAVVVTRNVLTTNGYQIVQVVPSGATQVIYYRRGNMGRGRGLGPIEKAYVVPA